MTYRRLAMISFLHRYFLDTDDKEFFTLPAAEKDSRLVDLIIKGKGQPNPKEGGFNGELVEKKGLARK